jgi:hypothetical protein
MPDDKRGRWRTMKIADDPKVYEWWYFDIHNHDGTVITGSSIVLRPSVAANQLSQAQGWFLNLAFPHLSDGATC